MTPVDIAAAFLNGTWPVLFWAGIALCVALGFLPGIIVRLASLMFPKGDPRRREMIAETYVQKWHERPLWAFEQIERGFTEGLPGRWKLRVRGLARRDRRLAKRFLDLTLSSIYLLTLIPVFLVLGILIRNDSPGPILFRQTRIGKDGRPFTLLKFRSMHADAEARLLQLIAETKETEATRILFKIREDPRITPLGRMMRKFSLDELPSLINVFRGEMSMVGSRPDLPTDPWPRADVTQKPGLSGLWPISYRLLDEDSDDGDYAKTWSLSRDIAIMVLTMWTSVRPPVFIGRTAESRERFRLAQQTVLRRVTISVRVVGYVLLALILIGIVGQLL